ncbi:MAG: hypothetical protein ACRDO1_03080 [Nocardioidaceae bacterium]
MTSLSATAGVEETISALRGEVCVVPATTWTNGPAEYPARSDDLVTG